LTDVNKSIILAPGVPGGGVGWRLGKKNRTPKQKKTRKNKGLGGGGGFNLEAGAGCCSKDIGRKEWRAVGKRRRKNREKN